MLFRLLADSFKQIQREAYGDTLLFIFLFHVSILHQFGYIVKSHISLSFFSTWFRKVRTRLYGTFRSLAMACILLPSFRRSRTASQRGSGEGNSGTLIGGTFAASCCAERCTN